MTRPSPRYDVAFVGFLLGHGGDALQMLQLAEEVQRRGARVRIVVPAGAHSVTFKERCDALGIECDRSTSIAAEMQGTRQRMGRLIRLLRSLDAAVIHVHTGNSVLPRFALVALQLVSPRRVVVTTHSPYETLDEHSLRARMWALATRRFAAVICPSDHARRFQLRCGVPAGRVHTVRNAVDAVAVQGGDGQGPRRQLGLGADTPIVLFCSRLDKQKRPVEAVEIFATGTDVARAAHLVFLGSGEHEQLVRDEVARYGLGDRVHLAGYQTNVPDWLAAATVWLLPTERENFSVAVLEALAAGSPVLASSCPGNDEVLVDGVNALTFAVGDVATASAGLRRLLADPGLRARIATGGRATAETYTVARMVDAYSSFYAAVPGAPAVLRPADAADPADPARGRAVGA